MKGLILILACVGFSNQILAQLNLCDTLNLKECSRYEPISLVTGAAELSSAYHISINEWNYTVVVDNQFRILELYVRDSTTSVSNCFVGSNFSQVDHTLITDQGMIPGYGYFLEMSDGWFVLFASRQVIEDRTIEGDSVISCFYKKCRDC